jgi:hypothetical protein
VSQGNSAISGLFSAIGGRFRAIKARSETDQQLISLPSGQARLWV